MKELAESLKVVLADTFAMYLKAHNYHWNVEGPNFTKYHAFLGGLYAELWAAVDLVAENIRTLDQYVPGSFERFSQLTSIKDELKIPTPTVMMVRLADDNERVLQSLIKARQLAEENKKYGIVNFLEDRISAHDKHSWMLKSFSKGR